MRFKTLEDKLTAITVLQKAEEIIPVKENSNKK